MGGYSEKWDIPRGFRTIRLKMSRAIKISLYLKAGLNILGNFEISDSIQGGMIERCANFILSKTRVVPQIAIILGSGLSAFAEQIEEKVEINYSDIPEFPQTTAPGHIGKFVAGKFGATGASGGKYVIAMCGRFHYYEGYGMREIALPIWILNEIGVGTVIVTNAPGGINSDYEVGDLVVISDHIKLCADSPLRGKNRDNIGPRFNDMTYAYTKELRELAAEEAYGLGITLREGVYGYMTGPSFETPAEVRMLDVLGADMVGMSTVPEVIAAAHCGMRVLGISYISNAAAGILDKPISHDEVEQAGVAALGSFTKLLGNIVEDM